MADLLQCTNDSGLIGVKARKAQEALQRLNAPPEVFEQALSPLTRLAELKAAEARLKGDETADLWDVVVHELKVLRSHLPYGGLRVDEGDLPTSDLDPDVLSLRVAPALGKAYLAAAEEEGEPTGMVTGVFYGPLSRPMLALTVARKGNCIWVPFLLDSGSAVTYVNQDVLKALGAGDNIPEQARVSIHGQYINAFLATQNVKGLCILGADYLLRVGGTVVLKYGQEVVELRFNDRR